MSEEPGSVTATPRLAEVPAGLAQPLRPHLDEAAAEMIREIQGLVPEYARPPDSKYGRRMRWTVEQTVGHFVDAMGRDDTDWDALTEIYVGIGAYEARGGRSLDGLQTAIRVCGQVACRRFIKDARRLGWSLTTLGQIIESLFVFLEKLAGAAARGYADAQRRLATERERHRWRLRDLLVVEPPASVEAVRELARPAGWEPPRTIALVALGPAMEDRAPVAPPSVLADWHGPAPYLIVPDPDGPGRERMIAGLVRGRPAAVGPTVPLNKGAVSLRWARRTLDLVVRGVIPEKAPVRWLDHVATLVASMSEELIDLALNVRLGPLKELPRHRREPLVRTLLAYMESRDNAVAASERLVVHEQTVRYRIRRLEQLLGDALYDPDRRIEMLLLLHAWVRFPDVPRDFRPVPGDEAAVDAAGPG
ncbi:PucR family transcriptional regulator [Actinomadura rugatobispora]|uniref:PucR family transcriptional regulator n=1 Tax=Actinomadura rugatobispora TaxID=1994 RepID=A0ABW1A8X8_9ACTN|nr:PucR family transcriptional regulator [Actinomadura rugatobispora]